MTSPTITELPRGLQPVTHDPFIDDLDTERAAEAAPGHNSSAMAAAGRSGGRRLRPVAWPAPRTQLTAA